MISTRIEVEHALEFLEVMVQASSAEKRDHYFEDIAAVLKTARNWGYNLRKHEMKYEELKQEYGYDA